LTSTLAAATPDNYVSLQVGTNVCFYVSTTKIWPYTVATPTVNNGVQKCSRMNLDLAVIKTNDEKKALWNMIRKLYEC